MHTSILSPESLSKIAREMQKYPAEQKQSAVMAALAIAQDEKGWLSTETMDAVAQCLEMPPIAVYEVASFYTMYNLQPTGQYKLAVCTNLPCALRGANELSAYLQKKLGIGFGETTDDQCFTLKESECMGACGDAPILLVNNKKRCSWLTPEKIDTLLEELKK